MYALTPIVQLDKSRLCDSIRTNAQFLAKTVYYTNTPYKQISYTAQIGLGGVD
jgi:hypothetical protein